LEKDIQIHPINHFENTNMKKNTINLTDSGIQLIVICPETIFQTRKDG